MAKIIVSFKILHKMKHKKISLTFLFIFILSINSVLSIVSGTNCSLEIQPDSSKNNISNTSGNWGGFLSNSSCTVAFNSYLYALARKANKTGQIYINSTDQQWCFDTMKRIDKENVFDCGFEKLVNGAGGCSDYTVTDVFKNLGQELQYLNEGCMLMGSDKNTDQECSACLRKWEAMKEGDVCRFTVLVSLTSSRIENQNWVHNTYGCLGNLNVSIEPKEGDRNEKKFSTGLWVLMGGLIGILLIILIASWILFIRRAEDDFPKPKYEPEEDLISEGPNLNIPLKEILSATNNLSALNFIGQGIAGKVFKGTLSNGQKIAVKHILNDGSMETFVREVTSLSHVRHPNLVSLIGYCEMKDECFLVYELCHNGNLSEWLYGKEKVLSWVKRLEIAIDCARGLWFLHTYPEGCIVHRDIKPTNILLSENLEAKLSDFGLSKVMDLGQSYVSSEIRGTFGYVDPEYQKNHHVNSSGDVYSFGMVLLQILSGKRVINLNSATPMSLGKMARFASKDKDLTEFSDPKLYGKYKVEAFDLVLKLALTCTGTKQQRPSMEEVVLRLEKALDMSTKRWSYITQPASNMG